MKKRLPFVAKWTSRAKALAQEECKLKRPMDPIVAKVVSTKKYYYIKRCWKR